MRGSFAWGRFRFEVGRADWESCREHGLDEDLEHDDFGLRLTGTSKLPDLGGAPLASWLLVRLARLTDDVLGLADTEHNDGGGYAIEFVVYPVPAGPASRKDGSVQPLLFDMEALGVHLVPERPVAAFQFQADMEGAGIIGQRSADCDPEAVLKAFAAALLASPTDLMPRLLAVRDPEWKLDPEMYIPRPRKGSRNWYGWDGSRFLGVDNIREAPL